MGWQVAGHALETGTPQGVLEPTAASMEYGEERARELALAAGAAEVTVEEFESWMAERAAGRANTYAIDVRQVAAYVAGHVPGAIALPGGLAIQRTDEFAPVRAARVVLIDDRCARAFLTAYWLRKIVRPRVYVLKGGLEAWRASGRAVSTGRTRSHPGGPRRGAQASGIHHPAELAALPRARVIDVDTSREYKRARVPGAQWIPYGWLEQRAGAAEDDPGAPLVLTCHDGTLSTFAAANLGRQGIANVRVLDGGVGAWVKAGLGTDAGWPESMEPADDLVVPPYHSNREAMARYLAWEQKLTAERAAPH